MTFNKTNRLLFLVLSIFSFSLSFPVMLTIFKIPNPSYIIAPIILLSLVAFFFVSYWVKLPLYFLIFFFCAYVSTGVAEKVSLSAFAAREYHVLQNLLFIREIDYTSTTIYSFFFLFLLLLIELQFVFKKVVLVGLACISYLMLLNVFNEMLVTNNVVLIALVTIFLNVLNYPKHIPAKFLLTVSGILIVIGFATLYFPKKGIENGLLNASQPYRDFIKKKGFYTFIAHQGSEKFKKTGFSENDTRLGGSLTDDYTIQFKVKQNDPHYWKIENKSFYTGKGWQKANKEIQNNSDFFNEITFPNEQATHSEKKEIELTLFYQEDFIPSTYGNLVMSGSKDNLIFNKNEQSNRVSVRGGEVKKEILLQLNPLDYKKEDIRKVSAKIDSPPVDYLQLPKNLPKTVKKLAAKLTKDKANDYDKVKAIETYLKSNEDYRYSKEDTSYPKGNQDYVADFLFNSYVGYCDNFSTAMAVMLRTIDIPTRWVKGFNSGSISTTSDGEDFYFIRNSNAHSWVEVYFETYGWIPFEPTPSFNYPKQSQMDTIKEQESLVDINEDPILSDELINDHYLSSTSDIEDIEQHDQSNIENKTSLIILLATLVFCCCFLVSNYWLLLVVLLIINTPAFSFVKLYPYLLKKAEKRLPRKKGQDLVSYANHFEKKFPQFNSEFSQLTKIYEESIYGKNPVFLASDKQIVKRVVILLHKK